MNKLKNSIETDFTLIPNLLINFTDISWKAKGIFAYLASKPDDWSFYMSDIEKRSTDGKTAVQTGIGELEDHGFLKRYRGRHSDGTISDFIWEVCIPDDLEGVQSGKTVRRKTRQMDNPSDGKTVRRKTASHSNTNNTKTNNTKTEDTKNIQREAILHPVQIGIRDNCPNIQKIPDQLTYEQAAKLVNEFGSDLVMEKIEGLENKKDAPKKYTSVYLTLRSWCRMELQRTSKNKPHDKNKTIHTAQQAFELGV